METYVSKVYDIVKVEDGTGVGSTKRYYLLAAEAPPVPVQNPPSGWSETEPDYDGDMELYIVDLTVLSDGTWYYSEVSRSSGYEAAKQAMTQALQTADRFTWLVESGTSSTDFTLTDRVASLLSKEFQIDALTTFRNSASSGSSTVIDGGAIKANTIKASQIDVTDLFAQDITAKGTITGVKLAGATGSFSGEVRASVLTAALKGTLACWNFDSTAIYRTKNVWKDADSIYFGTDGLSISDNFYVSSAGRLVAVNAKFEKMLYCENIRVGGGELYGTADDDAVNIYLINATRDDNHVYFGPNKDQCNAVSVKGNIVSAVRGWRVRLYDFGGGVYLGDSGSTAVTSDENLKDLTEIDDRYEDFFMRLRPVLYQYKGDGHHRQHVGYGARAVEKALLESGLTTEEFAGIVIDKDVTIPADENGTGEDLHYDDLYSLRYEEFGPLYAHMLQKTLARIRELEDKVKELKGAS